MFTFSPRAVKNTLVATTLALSAFSLSAKAALTSFTNKGADLVYSSVSDVTWTKDANLFFTLRMSDPNFKQNMQTIAASNGLTVFSDVSGNGSTSDWTTAYVFTLYLNSINYGGSNQWRLPTVVTPGANLTTANGTTAGDEFVELFYQELNGTRGNPIPNTAFFDNEQNDTYWTGTEVVNSNFVLSFNARSGMVSGRGVGKVNTYYVWAVTTGDLRTSAVSAVPVPAAAWLFGSGLVGLAGLRRRKQAV